MGFPKHIYRQASSILTQRRQQAELEASARKQELYTALPELRDIEQQLADCGRGVIAAVAARSGDARALVEQMKTRSLALQQRRAQVLAEIGASEELLEPQYHCPLCKDSGYDSSNRRCRCMEQLLRQLASQELGGTDLERFRFENFSLAYYGQELTADGDSYQQRMAGIFNYCKNYARSFDPKQSPSLLFTGGTGLGKTHLSLAIAREVIEGGHGVIYASVQNLMARLEEERFNSNYSYGSEEPEQRYLNMVLESDLLILDDLGTEFLNQFVSSSIYNLINTRLLQNRPTIISTNLLVADMGKRYSERLVSRLFGNYLRLNFVGKDVRLQSLKR